MSDPAYALQKALVARLKGDSGVVAMVAARIYDSVPKGVDFPYLSIGEVQVVPDEGDCYDGALVYFDLHVWSREPGSAQAKRIGPAVAAAVLADGLLLDGHTLISMASEGVRYLRDPDGITTHGVLSFVAETEPA